MGTSRAITLFVVIAGCGGSDAGVAQMLGSEAAGHDVPRASVAGSAAAAHGSVEANGGTRSAGHGGAGDGSPAASGGGGRASAAGGGVGGATSVASAATGGMSAVTSAGTGANAAGANAAGAAGGAGTTANAGTGGPSSGRSFSDSFDGDGPLMGYTTHNASALPDVSRVSGRYNAKLQSNANDITLHYNQSQGRLDARQLSFPFEVIARNIGVGTLADSQKPAAGGGVVFNLAGIQVHVLDLESRNSAHIVVGHSGTANFSIEGKSTVEGTSVWDNEGANANPTGRADLRIVGDADRALTLYWQPPNADPMAQKDAWKPYKGTGKLSGPAPKFGQEVYVGLITYAVGETGVPFVGTCDAFEGREQ